MPFKIFIRDGCLYIEPPRWPYDDEASKIAHAKIQMALLMNGMDQNELMSRSCRIDLSEHTVEKMCSVLVECIGVVRPELD